MPVRKRSQQGSLQGKHGNESRGQAERLCGRQKCIVLPAKADHTDTRGDQREKRIEGHSINHTARIYGSMAIAQQVEYHKQHNSGQQTQKNTAGAMALEGSFAVVRHAAPKIPGELKADDAQNQVVKGGGVQPGGVEQQTGGKMKRSEEQVERQGQVQQNYLAEQQVIPHPAGKWNRAD